SCVATAASRARLILHSGMLRCRIVGQIALLLALAIYLMFFFGGKETKETDNRSNSALNGLKEDRGLLSQVQDAEPLSNQENDLLYRAPIDVAFIFTHAKDNNPLQYKMRVAVGTLLQASSAPLRLHLITDNEGFEIASTIIHEVQTSIQFGTQHVKMVYVSAEDFIPEIKDSVLVLQDFFTSSHDAYYRDALFFFAIHMDKLLPGLQRVILMDLDIKVKGDIAELHSYFDRFSSTHIMGLAHEQSPVYRHLLSLYRNKHPDTLLGGPVKDGGFPGYNSGVMLIDIPKLQESTVLKKYLSRSKLTEKTNEYNFHGHLGDQDLYTLIAFDHPELFYSLPCEWNKQLCDWWRDHGYSKVFDDYFTCEGELKIIHGNCKTEIPDNL
ncbi:unnamed protein product, partial [Meganyctiphanes norvegica]